MKKIIDISQHNGTIDFTKVKNSGIDGVIIRVGWIGNYNNHTIDTKFTEYYNKAKTAGLQIGFYVYSYAKNINAIKSGVNWLITLIKGKIFSLPVFLDLEDKTTIGTNLTEQALTFCQLIEKQGYIAGIYANKDWFTHKIKVDKLEKYKIWLAEWNGKKEPTVSYRVDLWQYSDKGKVNGISGYVDMDLCLCDCQDGEPIAPKPTKFVIGKTYTTQVNLKVRKNAGTNGKWLTFKELTPNAKEHAIKSKMAILQKGTKVTCQGIYYIGNDIWIKIPSGYIAGYYQGKDYVK